MAQDIDIQNLSPDAQLTGFSKTSYLKSFMLSAVLHVVFIAVTSTMAIIAMLAGDTGESETVAEAETEQPADQGDGKADGEGEPDAGQDGEKSADGENKPAENGDNKDADPTQDPRFQNEEYKKKMNETAEPPKEPELGIDLDNVGI